MLRLSLVLCLILFATEALAARVVAGNETWSGTVRITESVNIPAGSTVTIRPGSELRFAANMALSVEGRLLAKGTTDKPIVFHAETATGSWQGLSFVQGTAEGSELVNITIEGAILPVNVTGSKLHIAASTLRGGTKGILLGAEASASIERVTLREMSEGAIEASTHSKGQISGCKIEKIKGFGILAGQQTSFAIRDNRISNVTNGILVNGNIPPLEGNIVDHCEAGIIILQSPPTTVIRNNQVTNTKKGIVCQQFASPLIERNTIEDCEVGIECFQASSPTLRQNRIARNQRGLTCVQMCNPIVTRNDFVDNQTAVYLHLSSYAHLEENNFERNRLHLELDNMSSDWEVRAKKKPARSKQKQNELLVEKGRAMPESFSIDAAGTEGFVNAKNNYWGKETTLEMNSKGGNANITAIRDGFDVPTRTYDGWPGSYKQDRVKYDGWKKQRLTGTVP